MIQASQETPPDLSISDQSQYYTDEAEAARYQEWAKVNGLGEQIDADDELSVVIREFNAG